MTMPGIPPYRQENDFLRNAMMIKGIALSHGDHAYDLMPASCLIANNAKKPSQQNPWEGQSAFA